MGRWTLPWFQRSARSAVALAPTTQATLASLEAANWFANVGVTDTDAAHVLKSWDEAIASCSRLDWENLCLEAANQHRARLAERSPQRLTDWNDVVARVKPHAQGIVQRKSEAVIAEHALPKIFVDTLEWDILHLLMEAEYADVHPPGFYASQAYWYVAGHFPCGWRGDFPEGKLVIF